LLGFHSQALTLQGKLEIHKSLKVIRCYLGSPSKSGWAHPHLMAGLDQPFVIKLKLHSCSGPTRGGSADAPLRGPQESRGPMNLNVHKGNGQLCTKFLS